MNIHFFDETRTNFVSSNIDRYRNVFFSNNQLVSSILVKFFKFIPAHIVIDNFTKRINILMYGNISNDFKVAIHSGDFQTYINRFHTNITSILEYIDFICFILICNYQETDYFIRYSSYIKMLVDYIESSVFDDDDVPNMPSYNLLMNRIGFVYHLTDGRPNDDNEADEYLLNEFRNGNIDLT